jgi:O-acetyl-ADP-ribose deacetylase (regulator of RNase III)
MFWTNPSVRVFSRDRDPIEAITSDAREVVFHALERGWEGPPFDPFKLAEILGIQTQPTSDVLDARTVPIGNSRFRIEFNPDRPGRRTRYSIFHEIAHTRFPDCAQMIRNRGAHNANRADDWQLETLCNVAAAEFLLPTGALGQGGPLSPSIDTVLELRTKYEASAEAALLRISRLTSEPALAFSCHRERTSRRYVIDYATPTAGTQWSLRPGALLPADTSAGECTAIGYTAKKNEKWISIGEVRVECVGISPFPREIYPRVIGFVRELKPQAIRENSITHIRGDATAPRSTGRKVVVQVVNDTALTWGGGGFAAAVRRKWPTAQDAFTKQVTDDRTALRLGNVIWHHVAADLIIASVVAQRGYGFSAKPRVRYGALRDGLLNVSGVAKQFGASVHMPRIGAGLAGGAWPIVEEITREVLIGAGVQVFVYDLPQGREHLKAQRELALSS